MIIDIGNIIIDKIKDLPFIDKYAGVVKPVSFSEEVSEGKYVKKIFPIACTTDSEECTSEKLKDLCPDSRRKSVLYLEDKGVQFVKREGSLYYFSAGVELVCWLNMAQLGETGCSVSSKGVTSILSVIPQTPKNYGTYQRVLITPLGQLPKSQNPFSKYSYDIDVHQLLLYPYDYFVMPMKIEFAVNKKCLGEWVLAPSIDCIENGQPCCGETPIPSSYRIKRLNVTEGEVDGTNQSFTTAYPTIWCTKNGDVQELGLSYTQVGNVITFIDPLFFEFTGSANNDRLMFFGYAP